MAHEIPIIPYNGLEANLPSNVTDYELILTTDTSELYLGNSSGVANPVKLDEANIINSERPTRIYTTIGRLYPDNGETDIIIARTIEAITIVERTDFVEGTSPSIVYTIKKGDGIDDGSAVTLWTNTANTGGQGETSSSFTVSTVEADKMVWIEWGTRSGTVEIFRLGTWWKLS